MEIKANQLAMVRVAVKAGAREGVVPVAVAARYIADVQ